MGLDEDQVNVLKRCFDGFADEDGAIPAENVGNILSMMGLKVGLDQAWATSKCGAGGGARWESEECYVQSNLS